MSDGSLWAIVISAFAAAGTIANFLFTQWRTDRREIAKWRRDELLKLTGEVLKLSRNRQAALLFNYEVGLNSHSPQQYVSADSSEKVFQLEALVDQIRLLDPRLSDKANVIYELHCDAEQRLTEAPDDGDHVTQVELLLVSREELNRAHRGLMASFSRALRG